MTAAVKGSLTIFFALLMLPFVTLCLVLIEGTRIYFLRTEAEQAMELAEFSTLSEYQSALLENYGVFFLDLDYEQRSEQPAVLNRRIREYLEKNTEELRTEGLNVTKIRRATDGSGQAFFEQATALMKIQSGYFVLEGIAEKVVEDPVDLQMILKKNENRAEAIADGFSDENGEALFDISIPQISFPSVRALTKAVFGSEENLSEKSIELKSRIGFRELQKGAGNFQKRSVAETQLFHGFLFEKYNHYGAQKMDVLKETLEYQLEYIVTGKKSDRENLENVMWRIFLLRAGGNYLLYHQDAEKMQKANAKAAAMVGIAGDPVLIQLVREIILVSQAIESGITETRKVFQGEKVPLYENGVFAGAEIGYREYLYLFLNTTNEQEKLYRSMDIAELEIRQKSGITSFRLDHCTDCFEAEWIYRFDSLLDILPFEGGKDYENVIKRKMNYEI